MALAGVLELQLIADVARIRKDMQDTQRVVGGAMSNVEQSVAKASQQLKFLAKAAIGAFAGVSLGGLIRDTAMLAARYETMGVVMRIAGNNAGYTMAQMDGFAKALQQSGISMLQSRNSLTQLATANIDLANATKLGRAAQDLAVVGNINSSEALGRLIHGVKSGQVEILRTLGLNVSFEASYKRMASQLGTTSEKLTEQQKITARTNATLAEAARYNGIYEESLTTAGKAMGSLTRYWEDLKVKAGEAFLPALAASVFGLTEALKDMNKELDAAGRGGLIADVGQGLLGVLKVAFETVAVLGANVAFVFKMMGQEIGAIAAQAAAVARLDFKGAATIGREATADAEAARAALDRFEQKILSAGNATKTAAKVSEQERIAASHASREAASMAALEAAEAEKRAKAAKEAAKATEQAIKQAQEYIAKLKEETQEIGLSAEQIKMMAAARAAAKAPTAALRKEIMASALASAEATRIDKEATELEKQKTEHFKGRRAAWLAQHDANEAVKKSAEDALKAARDELANRGKLKSEIEATTIARLEEKLVAHTAGSEAYKALEEQIRLRKELRGTLKDIELAEVNDKAAQTAMDQWKQVGDAFVDNLMRGGKSVAQYLKDLFRTLVLRPLLSPIGGLMAAGIGSLPTAANAAGSGMLGSLGGSALGSSVMGGLGMFGQAAGATMTNGLIGGFGANMANIGTLASGGQFMGALGGAAPYIGVALAAISLLKGAFKGETRSGGVYENGNFVAGPSGGEIGGDQVRQTIGVTMASINDTLKALGSTATLQGFVSGLEQSEKGKGFAFAGGRLSTGAAFGQGTDGLGYQNRRGSMTNEQASAAFAEELKQATLQALQAADVPGLLGDYLRQLGDIDALSGGALDAALARINKALTEKQSLEARIFELTASDLEKVTKARNDERAAIDESNRALLEQVYAIQDLQSAAEKFTARMQSIASKVDSVIQEFLSPEGYRQYTAQKLQQGLAAVGVNASIDQIFSATKEQYAALFRQLMDAGNLEAAEAVADLASTFLQLQPAADTAADSINRMAQALQDAGKGIAMYLRDLIATRAGTATPEALLSGTQANYLSDLSAARSGDLDANSRITQSAQAYLEAQKGYSASGGTTQAVISQVIAELQSLPSVKSYEAQSLDALGGILEALNDLPDSLSPTLAQAIAEKFDAIDLNGDGITFDELQAALSGKATDEQLRIMFTGLDANGDGTISRLEALGTQAAIGNLTSQQVLNRLREDSLLSYPAAVAGAAFQGIVDNTYLTHWYLKDMLALMRGGATLSGAAGGITGSTSTDIAAAVGSAVGGGGTTTTASGGVTDEAAFNAALSQWQATQTVMISSDPTAVYGAALSSGLSLSDVDALRGWPAGTSASWAGAQGLPSFEVGTNRVPQDMLAMVHRDEAIVPARYNPAVGGGDSREVVASIERLESRIAELLTRQITLEAQIGGQSIAVQAQGVEQSRRIADKAALAEAQ